MRGRVALIGALFLLVVFPGMAEAHPLGNFTVNRYTRLEASAGGIRVRYVLDLAEIPTLQELGGQPLEGPRRDRVLATKTQELVAGARLTVDGRAVVWTVEEATADLLPGQAGLLTLRIGMVLWTPVALRADSALVYRDTNYEGRSGWHELVMRGQEGMALESSDADAVDRSNELRAYPADPAVAPPDQNIGRAVVHFGAVDLGSAVLSAGAGSSSSSRFAVDNTGDQLTGMLRSSASGDPLAIAAALVAAMAFGGLHALGPGHGKAVVAAYLVGSQGTARHALLLGLTVTATHTAGVYGLGLLTLVAAQYVLPDRLYPFLGVISGALVVAIGVARLVAMSAKHRHPHGHEHHESHSHTPAPTLRALIGLGVSGGLLPCPTALVVLLAAISLHSVGLGMVLVAAFSVGLAAVLTAVGLALVAGSRLLGRSHLRDPRLTFLAKFAPAVSGAGIIVAGTVIAFQAIGGLG